MAPTGNENASSIALALAGMTESVKIPKPRDADTDFWAGKDSFAAVAARSAPTNGTKQTAGLPTPPNSISPSLPPQAFKIAPVITDDPPTPPGPNHVDSDIDLEDAVEHAKAQDSPQRGLTVRRLGELVDSDVDGAISPTMLAKHHLPDILLDHGPLAIRHVMGHLTTTVPGFSRIPPAKARRLVVGALEGRGHDGSQGGVDGDVMFEKVGWGRWSARKRGQSSRESDRQRRPSYPPGSLRIPITSTRASRRGENGEGIYGSHQDSEHAYDTHGDDASILEHEADQMSLDEHVSSDGRPATSKKRAAAGPPDLDDLEDLTDEEDWESMGAEALRKGSVPETGGIMPIHVGHYHHHHQQQQQQHHHHGRGRGHVSSSLDRRRHPYLNRRHVSPGIAKSMPPMTAGRSTSLVNNVHIPGHRELSTFTDGVQAQPPKRHQSAIPADAFRAGDEQDREAVEALLKLSSF